MSQITLTQGVTVHTLPYPSSYTDPARAKVATYTSYGGYRQHDKTLHDAAVLRFVQMQWQNADATELATITEAYRDMQLGSAWDYVGPDGTTGTARINPDLPELNTVRYAGADGAVLYTVRWNLVLEI